MKYETLVKKLEEHGYAYPSALRWSTEDIDASLRVIGKKEYIKQMSVTDKKMLLDTFFERNEDYIIEEINDRLADFLEVVTNFEPSKEIF
jgi:hypothetical protein